MCLLTRLRSLASQFVFRHAHGYPFSYRTARQISSMSKGCEYLYTLQETHGHALSCNSWPFYGMPVFGASVEPVEGRDQISLRGLGHALQCYFSGLIGCPASFRSGSIIAFLGWLMFPGPFNPRRTRRSWGEGMNVTLHTVFLQLRYEI